MFYGLLILGYQLQELKAFFNWIGSGNYEIELYYAVCNPYSIFECLAFLLNLIYY